MSKSRSNSGSTNPPVALRGSNQHLWNLLQGRVAVVADDVVFDELRDLNDRLVKGLTYYSKFKPPEDGENACIQFPSLPGFVRDDKPEDSDTNATKSTSTSSGSSKDSKEKSSELPFNKLAKAVAQRLNLDLALTAELLVSYMMFEYKGSSTTYDEIIDTHIRFVNFYRELYDYYKRERLCLLLCTQAILGYMGNEEHQFYTVIETFRQSVSFKSWCSGLFASVEVAMDETETVEILHALVLLMYKLPNDAIPEFFNFVKNTGFETVRKTDATRMAEGAVMFVALLVSGITDCCSSTFPREFSPEITNFLKENFENLLLNPYNIVPVFASYDIFCKEDPDITAKMKCLSCNPSGTFSSLLEMTEKYEKGSLHDRHSLSLVISASIFEAFEILLANYDLNHFGTQTQGFLILSKILQHNPVAENFLCGTPLALTTLYTDAASIFPMDTQSTLHLWKSLCMSVRSRDNCKTLIEGVAKLNCLADHYTMGNHQTTRRVGEHGVVNLINRRVWGVQLGPGITGVMNSFGPEMLISWEIPTSMEVSAFSVIRTILEPLAERVYEMEATCRGGQVDFVGFDFYAKTLFSTCEFIIEYMAAADAPIDELTNLIQPVCMILDVLIRNLINVDEKVRMVQNMLGIVGAVNEFTGDKIVMFNYIDSIVPGSNVMSTVETLILGRESVVSTECEVTLAFLRLIQKFVTDDKSWSKGRMMSFKANFLKSISFAAETLLPTVATWRVETEEIRLQVYLALFQLFYKIFTIHGKLWHSFKMSCLRCLISPNSCLVLILKTKEIELQNCVIKPTTANRGLGDVMQAALELIWLLIKFDQGSLMHLDNLLEGALVRTLGGLARHRINSVIPTISMRMLKEIAISTNLSLLACFGEDEAAFRDIIIQRLEFSAEDVNLKIAVLEFLTVISQTQVGIIQCFYNDGNLEATVIDLILEREDVAIACLHFFRSLFREGLPLSRNLKDFWHKLLAPIHNVSMGSIIDIVTTTLNILTFELFTNGTSDPVVAAQVEKLMQRDRFKRIIEVVVAEINEKTFKCLLAVEHYFTLLLGRPELTHLVPDETLVAIQQIMLHVFWTASANEVENRQLCTTLAEIGTILTLPRTVTVDFLEDLIAKIMETFSFHSLSVQLALLCLLNKCFVLCKGNLRYGIVENTIWILKKVFDIAHVVLEDFENPKHEPYFPLFIVTTTILRNIIESQPFVSWESLLQKNYIPMSLLGMATQGIVKKTAGGVVANCLGALVALASHPLGHELFPVVKLSSTMWLHLCKFTENKVDEIWTHVFFICLHLNSMLVYRQRYQYLDDGFAFWGLFSEYMINKLGHMTNLKEKCVGFDDSDKGYLAMKNVLCYNTFILNDILTLMPYLDEWQAVQPGETVKAIRGVFYALQESSSILRQPFLLQFNYKSTNKSPSSEVKLSPKLLEVQNRLWEFCDIAMQILVKVKNKEDEFFEKNDLLPTMFQMGQLCIKALGKSERKHHSSIHITNRISSILEKVMWVVLNYTVPVLEDNKLHPKHQIAFRREYGTEIVSLCDGIRRLGIPRNEFLIALCTKLESKFK